jgi:hypothetical protein
LRLLPLQSLPLLLVNSSLAAVSSAVGLSSIAVLREHPADSRLVPKAPPDSSLAARVLSTPRAPHPVDSKVDPVVPADALALGRAPDLAAPVGALALARVPAVSAGPVALRLRRRKRRARNAPVRLEAVADASNIRRPKKAR